MRTGIQAAGWLLAAGLLTAAEVAPSTLPLGSVAPPFALPGVDGRTWSLADFKESPVLVVVFTCVHCPTAQYYEERLKRLVTDYRPRGVALVAISPNDPEAVRPDELGYTDLGDSLEDMKLRAAHRQFNFPFLLGGGEHEAVARAYGPVATPHAFVFDRERKLRYVGRIDDAERESLMKVQDLRLALDALLAGHEPPVAQTRVFGCSTKWSDKRAGVKDYWAKVAKEPVAVSAIDADGLRALRRNAAPEGGTAKLRLINVWATWCGPCLTEMPDLMMIHRMYRQREFELVTVAGQYPDEAPAVLKALQQQQASTQNRIFGSTDKYGLIEAFDPEWDGALPYTVLVSPEGQTLYRRQGPIDALELRRLIVSELNRRKPW